MNPQRICSMFWLLFLLVWLVFGFRRKQTQERESLSSRLSYSIPTVLAFYLLFSDGINLEWLNIRLIRNIPTADWLGTALTAIGIAFAIWARVYIGENWSGVVTVKVGHELIRTGPYAWVRHPIYSGMLVATLGTALVRGEVRGLVAVAILWLAFWTKSRIEEQFMRKTFGEAYADYSKSTGALIPRLH
jgi:protein-S-isoprenylcysteine O-methyltransferase Ste14